MEQGWCRRWMVTAMLFVSCVTTQFQCEGSPLPVARGYARVEEWLTSNFKITTPVQSAGHIKFARRAQGVETWNLVMAWRYTHTRVEPHSKKTQSQIHIAKGWLWPWPSKKRRAVRSSPADLPLVSRPLGNLCFSRLCLQGESGGLEERGEQMIVTPDPLFIRSSSHIQMLRC